MKKIVFTLFTLATIASSAFAQAPQIAGKHLGLKFANEVTMPSKRAGQNLNKGAQTSYWYAPYDWVTAAGASMTRYVDFVFPDSVTKFIDKDGKVSYPGNSAVGAVCDPKDDNIQLSSDPGIQMTRWTKYTLDSIAFSYLYVRNVDSITVGASKKAVVDTLYIYYFPKTGLTRGGFSNGPEIFSRPAFNASTRKVTGYTAVQTVLLTRNDSTSCVTNSSGVVEGAWRSKTMTQACPAGLSISGTGNGADTNNIVAYTIEFRPGHSYDANSVMVYQQAGTAPGARTNYFGYGLLQNSNATTNQVQQTKFFNNSLHADYSSAYNSNAATGWTGFIPGNAYFNHQYIEMDFKLTSTTIGLNKVIENVTLNSIYPNPAKQNVTIDFDLKAASKVSIDIFNLVGQNVLNVADAQFGAGANIINANTASLTPGIYMVTIKAGNSVGTQKLVIAE